MLLKQFEGEAHAVIDAAPADVFAAITDICRLPDWNARIARVIQATERPLGEGVEWVVQISVPPAKWPSRTRVTHYDPTAMVFEHVSQSDDGNPSRIVWRWAVAADAGGSKVIVASNAQVKTFWRRLLFAKLRRKQLPTEVAASLDALAYHLAPIDSAC
jgi:hypothetical protein